MAVSARAIAAEFLGTMLLVATVIGSGVMAERLAGGNVAVALIGNTGATGAVLYVLITVFAPISGAQFNPAVTIALSPRTVWLPIIAAQIMGGLAGTLVAHAMFDMAIIEIGVKPRTGIGQWLGEFIATFGLLLTIMLGARHRPAAVPALVACWIIAGYWFTSSTSFANPAVTIARAFTDSFAGISVAHVPLFVVAQFAGAAAGMATARWLIDDPDNRA